MDETRDTVHSHTRRILCCHPARRLRVEICTRAAVGIVAGVVALVSLIPTLTVLYEEFLLHALVDLEIGPDLWCG